MNRFNKTFQKSNENTTCELYTDISRLVRIYAVNILTQQSVLQAGDNLHTIGLNDRTNLKPYESEGIGDNSWASVSELEKELNIAPFLKL